MTAVLNLTALAEGHEPVAGSASPIAGGAKAGDVSQFHQPADNFIQGAAVADIKLSRIFGLWFWRIVSANTGTGCTTHL